MSSLPTRSLGRRKVAATAAALVAFGGLSVFYGQSPASAHETTVTLGMTCQVAGAIDVDYTVSHEPEAGATAGELFTINTSSKVATDLAIEVGLKTINITIPTPAGVTNGGQITTTGGNLHKTGQAGSDGETVLTLTADAGVTNKTMQMPTLHIPVMISAKHPETINFAGPSTLALGVIFSGQDVTETCTANDGNPPLLSIKPTGGSVVAAPPTTKKTTTTVKGAAEAGGATPIKATPQFTG
jgi:hypothetical protein